MKWFLIFILFAGGLFMLLKQQKAAEKPQTSARAQQTAAALPAPERSIKKVQEEVLPERADNKGINIILSDNAKTTLYQLTQDSNEKIRWTAIELLYKMGDPRAKDIISRALSDEQDTGVKINIVRMLGDHKDMENLNLLTKAYKDNDKDVRLNVIDTLGRYDTPQAAPLLTKAMKDEDNDIKLKAMEVMKKLNESLYMRKAQIEEEIREAEKVKKMNALQKSAYEMRKAASDRVTP